MTDIHRAAAKYWFTWTPVAGTMIRDNLIIFYQSVECTVLNVIYWVERDLWTGMIACICTALAMIQDTGYPAELISLWHYKGYPEACQATYLLYLVTQCRWSVVLKGKNAHLKLSAVSKFRCNLLLKPIVLAGVGLVVNILLVLTPVRLFVC